MRRRARLRWRRLRKAGGGSRPPSAKPLQCEPQLGVAVTQIIDETEADLRQLIENDLEPVAPSTDIWHAAIDWGHYKARQIPHRPRRVIESSECARHRSAYPAINRIANELRMGGDLTPWLSDRIRRVKADPKADLMFNDWQVHHFHLGGLFVGKDKVKRSGRLLFAYITSDKAVLLDVQPHGSWTMQSLFRILLQTGPQDMELHETHGILAGRNYTADEAYKLREVGISTPFQLEGRVFFPPGLSLAGQATRLRWYVDALRLSITTMKKANERNKLPRDLMSKIAANLSLPVRLGLRIDSGQLILMDKYRQIDLSFMPPLQ
jgi:hypothetical protein